MINSFSSMQTIIQGLQMQQLLENITASNLADTSVDSNGYLVSSLQQANFGVGPSEILSTTNGNVAVSSGPLLQSITQLRSSFLDSQIQQESSIVGAAQVQNQIIQQINGIINGSSGTINDALNNLAAAWTALAPNPTDPKAEQTVVSDGVAFATLANNQYTQLQELQSGLSTQVQQTVGTINQLLQQLSSINQQLLNSQGSDPNALLDARDYALDQLSRLVNIQSNYGVAGTVAVNLAGSGLSLVDAAGAAILGTDVMNAHNPSLVGVSYQSSEGSFISPDITQSITGGELGGYLQGMNTTVENYKNQLNQAVFSVITNTNILTQAGYSIDNLQSTNIPFFTGSSAQDINVNGALIGNPANLPTSSRYSTAADPALDLNAVVGSVMEPGVGTPVPVTNQGQIAMFLGNLPNLLAINYMQSKTNINQNGVGPGSGNTYVDPNQAFNSLVTTALNQNFSNSVNFTNGLGAAGTFTINGQTIPYTNTESINSILDAINQLPNVQAVFNYAQQSFYILSDSPINFSGAGGNFASTSLLKNFLTSSFVLNNSFAYTEPAINGNIALNTPYNTQAFQVTPGTSGSVVVNGTTIVWNSTESLNQILASLPLGVVGGINNILFPASGPPTISPYPPLYNNTVSLISNAPISIADATGNFTAFTGLDNPNITIGGYASGILSQATADTSNDQLVYNQANAALTQLENAQDNLAGIATTAGQPGVPIATIEQQATQEMIAYNAMLEVLEVIDNMYSDLVGILNSSTPSGSFQNQSAPV
jgi:flagellar hook-associated protein FlgK